MVYKFLMEKLPSLNDFQTNIFIVLLIVIIFITGYLILNFILHKVEKKSQSVVLKKLREKLKLPTFLLVITLSVILGFSIVGFESLNLQSVRHFLSIVLIICISWFSIRAVSALKLITLSRYDLEDKDNLKARKVYTQFRIFERIIIFVIILVTISIILMTFDKIRNIGISLFASAGVAGLIIGLAAQRIIASVLAGFQIAITQPIRIDDVVIVENEWGWIEEITLTYVVVKIWDKRRLIVPTTYFIEKPFQNWTRVSADILGTVYIYTDYQIPVDELRKELKRILENSDYWDGNVCVLQVTNATEKTIELRALMSAVDSPTAWNLRVHVREKLIEFLQKNYPDCLPQTRVKLNNQGISPRNSWTKK
jgi:small-conductance mechanosensitive channel